MLACVLPALLIQALTHAVACRQQTRRTTPAASTGTSSPLRKLRRPCSSRWCRRCSTSASSETATRPSMGRSAQPPLLYPGRVSWCCRGLQAAFGMMHGPFLLKPCSLACRFMLHASSLRSHVGQQLTQQVRAPPGSVTQEAACADHIPEVLLPRPIISVASIRDYVS